MEHDASQRLEREVAEELEHDVVPEQDAVVLPDRGDVAVEEVHDLLEGSVIVRGATAISISSTKKNLLCSLWHDPTGLTAASRPGTRTGT